MEGSVLCNSDVCGKFDFDRAVSDFVPERVEREVGGGKGRGRGWDLGLTFSFFLPSFSFAETLKRLCQYLEGNCLIALRKLNFELLIYGPNTCGQIKMLFVWVCVLS